VNLLLDTQALLWFLSDDPRLHGSTRELIADPTHDVFISAASVWEIAIKIRLGKLAVPPDIAAWLPTQVAANRFIPLPITLVHAAGVEHLPMHHVDPFDRLLISQAQVEHLTVLTSDAQFELYEARLVRC
jgi:PIN domain nuclease of toxin-antitoxin system